ncbi:hypothetical protein MRB53_018166 [Persea americana]|uniref:Uncharacterized protein n=1 Tax=Persea americana TaxID=3435 RepID=A0ACC2M6P4_PERAE|nr:hypothetical protein MRB53_018166 [Persea americana]
MVPHKFNNLKLLFELDLSNNRFAHKFPYVVLDLPSLKFLDLRFNEFEGKIPKSLFNKDLDAIFTNHNRFASDLPDNIRNSPVSAIVLTNNRFSGCVSVGLGNMSKTLNEIILMNNGFRSCISSEIRLLRKLTVLDFSFNRLMRPIPDAIGGMKKLEQLNPIDLIYKHHNIKKLVSQHLAEVPSILLAQTLQASSASIPNFSSAYMVAVESPHERNENDTDSAL